MFSKMTEQRNWALLTHIEPTECAITEKVSIAHKANLEAMYLVDPMKKGRPKLLRVLDVVTTFDLINKRVRKLERND